MSSSSVRRPNPRAIAIKLLQLWEREHLPLEQLFEQHPLLSEITEPRDRQLALALVYGVIRWRGYLDWVLARFSTTQLRKMKPLTLQALRVGVFQLLFLDRVPAAAALNETVGALKGAGQPKWLTGFVNGLLRNIARHLETLPDPWQVDEAMELTARLSHPAWLLERWQARYGLERAIRIGQANNRQPPLTLRVNTCKISRPQLLEILAREGIAAQAGRFAPAAVRLLDFKGQVTALPGYEKGHFQVQDEAAQLAVFLLQPFSRSRYLDGCAGLGGKATQLAELVPESTFLGAVEPQELRFSRLQENLGRLDQGTRVKVIQQTLEEYAALGPPVFDRILLDVPCSGLGVIRRHPEIRWSRAPEELTRLQEKQLKLLETGARLLAPGGILVYATCSTEPEENEEVVCRFLRDNGGFKLSSAREYLPAEAAVLTDGQGFYRALPDQEVDGFFGARLEKAMDNG